ncbi:MAG: SurA N-terminal domain-containing protein [Rickettsiales bacterium]|jgi:peptidyl-prolyl cis-trans isomerase SurA|nr:SurA N-terminal domain-containing protein [Rickettsiales bacterium]
MKLGAFLFLVAYAAFAPPLLASSARIEAVVNGVPITTYELSERVRLARALLSAAKVKMDGAEIRRRVLAEMVDDRLRIAEAAKYGVAAAPDDIEQGVLRMERYLNLPAGGYRKLMRDEGIPEEVMKSQIAADAVWMKFSYQVLRSLVHVSDRDVERHLENLKNAGSYGYTLVPLVSDAADAGRMSSLVSNAGTCEEFMDIAAKNGLEGSGVKITVSDSEMQESLLKLVESAPVSSPLPPLAGAGGLETIFFICAKEPRTPGISKEEREKIKFSILADKLDAASARYFERLKAAAVIEIKD